MSAKAPNKDTINRISIDSRNTSSEAIILEKKLASVGIFVEIQTSHDYIIKKYMPIADLNKIGAALHNEISHTARVNMPFDGDFDFALELGFLPGVTDNVANTTREIIEDIFSEDVPRNAVSTSTVLYIKGKKISQDTIVKIAHELINPLIERFHIKAYDDYQRDEGMDNVVPQVKLEGEPRVISIDLDIPEKELLVLGKKGIKDPVTGQRRGPLALDKDYLMAIKAYYKKIGRKPTDIELESIAQTWSEHCKHTYFAGQIDDIQNGIYEQYIKRATNEIRKELGEKDFCISVFKDNAGGIEFDGEFMVADKVETHNSPSALDPFGGAITGIVGVNRDCLGFGYGARPIANRYGFCVGFPDDTTKRFRDSEKTNPALSPRRILDGVVHGVNVGGNCSGIPTPQGFVYFDESYAGKPLIFVGTIGLIPKELPNGKESHLKGAQPGDHIVVIGGRVGKDGIHGATFSSEALDSGSPATAVQIGDPITQKKLSDAIIYEARDQGLFNSITDNGAGGISCSIAEMARECGGFVCQLDKVPLKYPGLQPWEIWISESQERMTLSVPPEKIDAFLELMESRGVEAVSVGKFNDSGKAVVLFNGKEILDLDMEFLHNGLPKRIFVTQPYKYNDNEPKFTVSDHAKLFEKILTGANVASFSYISRQYDHEVQNNSVIKPIQGQADVNNPATVIKPRFDSFKGVVLSQGICPRLSEISCYDMAANAIDLAIRNCISVGGDVNHMALLDNFCWCSSDKPDRLEQLKDTAKACYDLATIYLTPYISGKDSMFNDFKGFDADGNELSISALPTLLISSIGVIDDVRKTVTQDFKSPGDIIYIIGTTKDECAGSEFYKTVQQIGANVPKVNPTTARQLYESVHSIIAGGLVSACAPVGSGGLLIAVAKMAMAGNKGAEIDLTEAPIAKDQILTPEKICYSETPSRFIVAIDPQQKDAFEEAMKAFDIAIIGKVSDKPNFTVAYDEQSLINTHVDQMIRLYQQPFKNF